MTFQAFPPTSPFQELAAQPAQPLTSHPVRNGVHLEGDGVDVAVLAAQATRVDVCFFEGTRTLCEYGDAVTTPPPAPHERRYTLKRDLYGLWTGHIPGITEGTPYGFRAYGTWDPSQGSFYNPAKVMLDPYATAIAQMPILHSSLYGHVVDAAYKPMPGYEPDTQDSAQYAALGQVTTMPPPAGHIRIPWDQTVIYEAHVVGLTANMPGVPEHLRGTYAGVAHPACVAHLKRLGVTTLELLPIFTKMSEPFLTFKGLSNYWGYNTLNFFTPEPSYATSHAQSAGAQAVLDEVRGMVSILHEAGIEVVLDVVYNHTSEAGVDGPSTSFRGLDHLGYYRYSSFNPGELKDTTGCGNSLDFRRFAPIHLTIDSLRYWVKYVGIDGFRFDLAVTLGREGDSFNQHHPMFTAALTDPLLKTVKIINEPWDVGMNGWQTGNFQNATADWNDRFRDTVRSFWLTEPAVISRGGHGSSLRDIATRMSGSQDIFAHGRTLDGRGVFASVNFVTAHDGFSMWDLVSFNSKHNEANLENNRDGSDGNHSWNHGVEGFEGLASEPDGGAAITAARRRSVRNMMGTLLLSAGTPMLRAGDEILKSQAGNNNAYCQNNSLSWLDWNLGESEESMFAMVADLVRLRAEHPVLRPQRFFRGAPQGDDELKDLEWFAINGETMPDHEWFNPHTRSIQLLRSGRGHAWDAQPDRDALIVINGSLEPCAVTLTQGRGLAYKLMWCSAWENITERTESTWDPGAVFNAPELSISLFFA